MDYKKTLRWTEPYDGWADGDTGLCNRIFHWEIAYEINKNSNYIYKILLEKKHWPELDLISLPYTATHINFEHEFGLRFEEKFQKLKFLTVFDIENEKVYKASKLSKHIVESMFTDNFFYLSGNDHWYSDFGYNEINKLYGKPVDIRPLSLIRLRHSFVEDFLRRNTFDVVGLHLRRNAGVEYNNDDIDSLPTDIKEEYLKFHRTSKVKNRTLKFAQDEKYFKIMDNMLKINPEQKFYISTDLPVQLIKNFYEKYGDKIITRVQLYDTVRDHLLNSGVDVVKLKRGQAIENVVDLFALSFCKFLIKCDNSTWSEFAQIYRGQPSFSINDDWQTQMKPKYIKPNWIQPGDYYFNGEDLSYEKLNRSFMDYNEFYENF